MDEAYYVYFKLGERQLCTHCVETMIEKQELTLATANESQIFPAEPWTLCERCGLPVAREECIMPFERVMNALYALEYGAPPPFAQDDPVAKANEEVRRLKAEVGAAYRKLVAARNEVIRLKGRLDEPALE
jgi:hypothetical protein